MWVERIEIGGFGRLRNLSIDLRDGLNVVTGLNEAGKSTLHQAIATGALRLLLDAPTGARSRTPSAGASASRPGTAAPTASRS